MKTSGQQSGQLDEPHTDRLSRITFEAEKARLHEELVKLQVHVRSAAEKVLILFEGRETAGTGRAITCFMRPLNPRGARVVALDEPTVAERTQWYFQRYVAQLPSGGELVLMNRSWYNRAGVERVMDYCTTEDYDEFLRTVPEFERMLIGSSVRIVKLWFTVEQAEQQRRFDRMRDDPLGQWRLSPTDIAGMSRWDAYRTAEETMFARTDAPDIPWMVVRADDRRRARLEAMRYVLSRFEYPGKDPQVAHAPDTRVVGRPRRREDAADE